MSHFAISFGSFALGVICLVIGAGQIYRPLGLIVLGLALIGFAVVPKVTRR